MAAFDLGPLHKILKDGTRRRILLLLRQKQSLTYVEILNSLEISHTGRLNYHLKILGDLVQKDEDSGKYSLTEKGAVSVELLDKFQSDPASQVGRVSILSMSVSGWGKLFLVAVIPLFFWRGPTLFGDTQQEVLL